MNIDDLKGAWGKEEPEGMQLPNAGIVLSKTTSVVEKIRKKMRLEFRATLVTYAILIGLVIFLHGQFNGTKQEVFFLNTISLLLFMMIILNGYFFSRFYIFYKNTGRYDLGMRESIKKIAYELELNTEIYKAYTIAVAPFSALIGLTLVGGQGIYNALSSILSSGSLLSGKMIWLFATIFLAFALPWYINNLHVKKQYGKYLAELKQVADDLESAG